MKKLLVLKILDIFILLLVIITLLVCYYAFNNIFNKIWYIILIFYCAVTLYTKYFLFRNDNILWFAIVLTGLWIFMIAYNFYGLSYRYWPLLAQIPSIASGIVYLVYKSSLHLYLNTLVNTSTSPLMLFTMGYINVWWLLLLEVCAIILAFVIVNFIEFKFRRR